MRGDIPTGQNISCYLVARVGSTMYIYYRPFGSIDNGSDGNPQDQGFFASLGYYYNSSYKPLPVRLTQSTGPTGNPLYTLSATNSAGVLTRFITKTKTFPSGTVVPNVLDLSLNSSDLGTPLFLNPASNVDLRKIYAGVWYTAYLSDGLTLVNWVCTNGAGSNPFRGLGNQIIVNPSGFQLMFIPVDAGDQGGIGVWNPSGSATCLSPDQTDASLAFFTYWALGDTINGPSCLNSGWLSSGQQRCLFTSLTQCQQEYLYKYCDGSLTCGTCLGVCPAQSGTIPFCQHDYDPSYQKNGSSPLSCDPKEPNPPNAWARFGALFIFFGTILLILILLFYWYYSNQKKTHGAVQSTSLG